MNFNKSVYLPIITIILSIFFSGNVFANSYTSEVFTSLESCNTQKTKNNTLYPNFYRSDCTESKDNNFYYNICDTNYCVTTDSSDKFIEVKDSGIYQYDSNEYKLDDATNEKVKSIAEGLEKKFQEMSEGDLDKWKLNFEKVISSLAEQSSENDKNLALITQVQKEVSLVITKQQQEHDLCKKQYGEGWKEASFFFESNNMVSWIEGNKKHSLACEFIEVEKEPIILTPEEEKENNEDTSSQIIDQKEEIKENDITQPVQGIYRATSKKYLNTETSQYTSIDVCAKEFGLDWQESTEKNIDPYIMLYSKYNIETTNTNYYWDGKKLVRTPNDIAYHKACVKNTLSDVVSDKYKITQGKYRGNILREGDICTKEYGDSWKVTTDRKAFDATFEYHKTSYPSLRVWALYTGFHSDNCGGFHSNNSWNGFAHTMDKITDNPKKANSCSYDPEKYGTNNAKSNLHFVCEKTNNTSTDITPVVQGLYKITQNKYDYNSAYKSSDDVCKTEYGRDWKRNTESLDANLMLYSEYKLDTWIYNTDKTTVWDGSKEVKKSSGNLNHVACVEDIYHHYNENYDEYLTPVSEEGVHSFMKGIESEMKSKIQETNTHVFFNNKYAITQKKYYGNQIYSERTCPNNDEYCNNGNEISGVCPIGYKLDDFTLKYNNYEKELIGYYISQNLANLSKYSQIVQDKIKVNFWRWGKYDESFVRQVSLDRIKKESQTTDFSVHQFNMANAGLSMRATDKYNEYDFWTDLGSSDKVGTLLPALCVNKNAQINTSSNQSNILQDFKGIQVVEESFYLNDSDIEGSAGIFFTYGNMIARGFFDKSSKNNVTGQQFFLPIRKTLGSSGLLFIKKYIK